MPFLRPSHPPESWDAVRKAVRDRSLLLLLGSPVGICLVGIGLGALVVPNSGGSGTAELATLLAGLLLIPAVTSLWRARKTLPADEARLLRWTGATVLLSLLGLATAVGAIFLIDFVEHFG